MKKLISVVLSAMLLMSAMICVSAEKPAAEVEVSTVAFDVTVTVTTEAEGRMTAILRNEANNVFIDMDQTDDFTKVDGKSVYTFRFVMQPNAGTDAYTVTVGGCVATKTTTFGFTNIDSLISYYNTLNEKDAAGIRSMLQDEANCLLSYDLTAYRALEGNEKICGLVDAEIVDWDLATDRTKIAATETFFKKSMDTLIARTVIVDKNAADAVWKAAIDVCVENGILDAPYLVKKDAETKVVAAETARTYFKNATIETILAKDIQVALDGAQLLAVASKLDYASLNDAFDYYLGKGIVNIDKEKYAAVCKKDKADALFKTVKEKTNNTIKNLEDNVNNICATILGGSDDNGKTSSGGGNGYAGGGIGGTTMENTAGSGYSDLGEATWAASSIEALTEKGVISGRGDGKFYPNDIVTREEFVKIIITAFNALDEKATASFSDVAENRWSYKYIATANRLGLVTGQDATSFNPTGTLTRENMAVIMHRAMKLANIEDGAYAMNFTDSKKIAGYAVDAVKQLSGKKIINGMGDGTFAPKSTVTRAQAAKVVYELLALIGGVN